jgi:hypothetical protein
MRPITGENGDLLYGAQVLVREAGLSVKLAQTLFAGPTGDQQLSNPFVAANGVIDFWLEDAQRVSVLVQSEQHSDILVYLDAAPAPEDTARTDTPLLITGEQVPGNVLLAGENPGEAVWGPPPMNSGLTPQVTVISEAFARGQDPAGWSFFQAANSSRDYVSAVPEDQGLIRSLHVTHTGSAGGFTLSSPGFTLIEPGAVAMWLRPSLTANESVVISVTPLGGSKTILQTITTTRDWGYYRYALAAGTYQSISIEFVGAATFVGSTGHELWITGIKAVYGGRVPAHDHPGSGASSVQLGAGSSASGANSVSIGAGAKGSGSSSVAVGSQSQATGVDSVAVGPGAQAVADTSIAVGPRAKGSLANTGWTSIGADAYSDAANSTAIGTRAKSYGASGTAIGTDAYVGADGTNSLAVGNAAQALAANAIALGNAAVVGAAHSSSVALGSGATTGGVQQVVLGAPLSLYRSVIVSGRLIVVSTMNVGSDATSRLGFYGAEGTSRPVVTGSDGGVVALRNLLGALAGLGLITNNTTP